MIRYRKEGRTPIVIHLGDHDPSGLDMSRDVADRLSKFALCEVEVIRIALNMDQIMQYSPPPNPAKITDCRFENYQQLYGDESWELDALDPVVLRDLIRDTVAKYRNDKIFKQRKSQQEQERRALTDISDYWEDAVRLLKNWKEEEGLG